MLAPEIVANPRDQFFSPKLAIPLDNGSLAVDPVWLDGTQPRALDRQSQAPESHPTCSFDCGLPDRDQAKAAVLASLRSPESQRGYQHSIDEFISWYCSEPRLSFNKTVVTRYRIHLESRPLAPGTINVRLAAVRRLAYEAADSGLLSPELAAGIGRVKGARKLGVRLGNWLTAEQARTLWQLPNPQTLKGKRDRAILSILLGCGLRRRELVELTFDHLQQREGRWAVIDLVGKAGHIRTVPVPD
jgi:site-specific recombinase XerD